MAQNDPLDGAINEMIGPSQQRLADVAGATRGISALVTTAVAEYTSLVTAMPTIAQEAATRIRETLADATKPYEYRRDEAKRIRDDAELVITKYHKGAQSKCSIIEGGTQDSCLPSPPADASQRALARDEIRTRFSGLRSSQLSEAVIKNLGRDSRADGELLSSFGESMFAGSDAADHFKSLRASAIERYSKPMPGMSQRQIAAVKAVPVVKAANLSGSATAFHTAALLRLRQDDRLPARRTS